MGDSESYIRLKVNIEIKITKLYKNPPK